MDLSVWMLSVSIIIPRYDHVVCVHSSPLLIAAELSVVRPRTCECACADWLFQVWAITDKVTTDVPVQVLA